MNTPEQRRAYVETIASFPDVLEALVKPLTDAQLTTHFIPNEWTVAQNVHHLADAHMNSFIRCKLMLTENHPTLKPYDQETWAETPEYNTPIVFSLSILRGLHGRWAAFFSSLTDDQWTRTAFHPEYGEINLDGMAEAYHRHCHVHLDQIQKTLAAQNG